LDERDNGSRGGHNIKVGPPNKAYFIPAGSDQHKDVELVKQKGEKYIMQQ